MRIGVVTPEFPPMVGGTSYHAFGLVGVLARTDQITVLTSTRLSGKGDCWPDVDVQPVLTGRLNADAARLETMQADAWLVLNAGYAPLSITLNAPTFVYCHGNDFLDPWIRPEGNFFINAAPDLLARSPFLWRSAPTVRFWFMRPYTRNYIARGLKRARHVFVNSYYTLQRLRRTIPSFTQAVTISHPGIDTEFLADDATLTRRMKRRRENLHLLTITRLESHSRHKAIEELLYAVTELDDVALTLTIVGDGDDRGRLEALSQTLRLNHRVTFAGVVSRASLSSYLDDADLLVLASDDSFGMVYVEAAARGVPSLARTKSRAVDALIPGTTGLSINSAAPSSIAAGIRRFKGERELFDPFQIRNFAQRFVWPNIGAALRAELIKRL